MLRSRVVAVMTVHRLHAGDGYTYLTRQVATADHTRSAGEKLVDYYTANGTPPGRWHGQGAAVLGVSGAVSEAQMKALFGEGLHPDADRIIAEEITEGASATEAVAAARLGSAFYRLSATQAPVAAGLATAMTTFQTEHGRPATPVERNALRRQVAADLVTARTGQPATDTEVVNQLGADTRGDRHPVAGFDLVFTPQKSVSLLWGLGSDEVRRTVEQVHHQAVADTLKWVQAEAGRTRRGRNGVRQIDTQGLVVVCFDHYDNRDGDPNLHTHATVSNKVLGVDGKWSALDARVLYAAGMAGAARYNSLVVEGLRRELGVRFTDRSRGAGKAPVQEVEDITDAVVADFSRRADITARTEELAADYLASHGHRPGRVAQLQLAQQAVLDTRSAKAAPRSLAAMRGDWATQAGTHTHGEVPADWVDRLLAGHRQAGAGRDGQAVFDPAEVAGQAVATVSRRRATWTEANLRTAIEDACSRHLFATPAQARAAVEEVVTLARDQASVRLSIEADGPAPEAIARADGASVTTMHGQARFTSEAVLAAERTLVDAAHTPTTCFVTGTAVTAAIDAVQADTGRVLNEGQRLIATHLATSGQVVAVAVGPAGTGKTTAMATLVRAWTDDGRQVIPLAPSAAAARVLGDDLGVEAQTVAKLLTVEHHRDQDGQESTIQPGAMLLVDEAGMTATADLKALVDLAQQRGAVLRMVGDPHQLAAVESGGALRLLAADTGAPELSDVVRFTDPGEAQAGLAVRGGDHATAWEFYTDRHRVTAGTVEGLRAQVLAAHTTDTAAGRRSLMLAATTADVAALNAAAHQALVEAGRIDPDSAQVGLRDGLAAQVGDTVVTRRNDPGVRIVGGNREGAPVTNGDLWRVRTVHRDGSLTLSGTTHRGTLAAPAGYVAEHVELGYAATVHRAQGMTVDTAHLLMDPTLTRAGAYVGLTRGRHTNHLYLVTDEVETAGTEAEAHHHPGGMQGEQAPDPAALFAGIVARTDDNLTATETLTAELDHTDDTTRLRQIHSELVHDLTTARGAYLLGRALPAVHEATTVASPHYRDLLNTVAAAHTDSLDTGELVTAITTAPADQPAADLGADPDAVPDSLTGARDTSAVLRARADTWIAARTTHAAAVATGAQRPGGFRAVRDLPAPTDLTPTPARHPGADTDLADHTTALAARITRLEAAAEAGRAQHPDAELVAVMREQRVRLRPDHDLDRMVLLLRSRLSTAGVEAHLVPAPPMQVATTRARQEKLRTQAAAAASALATREVSERARRVLTTAQGEYFAVSAQRAGTPARRVLRRRELDGTLAEAFTRANAAAVAANTAHRAADAAAGRVGAPWGQWQSIVNTAADTSTLAAELAAAEASDARDRSATEQMWARRAQRNDLTRRQLTGAENERARRRALPPDVATAEARIRHQLREEAPRLQAPAPSPSLAPAAAALVAEQLAQDQSRDQGLDYGL